MYYIEKVKDGYYLMKGESVIAFAPKKSLITKYCKDNGIMLGVIK